MQPLALAPAVMSCGSLKLCYFRQSRTRVRLAAEAAFSRLCAYAAMLKN